MKRYGLILVILLFIFTFFVSCSNNSSCKNKENTIASQDENSSKESAKNIEENTVSDNTNKDNTELKKEDLTNHKVPPTSSSNSTSEKVQTQKPSSINSQGNSSVNSKGNSNQNTDSKNENAEVYKSPLGFSISFPDSWNGLYTISEDDHSFSVYFKQTHEGNYGQGLLFTIQKKTDDFDETLLDSIGNKRYIVAKDILYVIGGPTDVNFSPDSPDFSTFQSMHDQSASVIDSIKIIN